MEQVSQDMVAFDSTTADQVSYARADAALLGLLSTCLLRPSVVLVAELCDGTLVSKLRALLELAPADKIECLLDGIDEQARLLRNLSDDEARLVLEVEYNRLFVGPGEVLAPPYESYYESSRASAGRGWLRTQAERDVVQAYAECGFAMPENFVELPDHVAVELEFLALLASREAEAWDINKREVALALQASAAEFIVQHLGTWLESCAALVEPVARQPFYAAILSLSCVAILGPER
ncbi:MAG: molecular chaperone TorD family protein [Gordonibacter sp.]|nr:molecular chaperone TorD family protein [Gordonibacter sp.]